MSDWISVEDRTPDTRIEKLLVTYSSSAGRTVEMARYMNGHLVLLAFEVPDGAITHYMPLPEPPKEEGNNRHGVCRR